MPGCGSNPAPPPLSLISLRTAATAICAATSTKTGRISPPASAAGAAAFLARGATLLKGESDQLRRLRAPAEWESEYRTALADLDSTVSELARAASDLRTGDPVIEIRLVRQRLPALQTKQDQSWKALGIPACEAR